MKAFKNGLATGLILQLAVGPVFFFIANLTLQRTVFDGLAGVAAVTAVDYLYIALAVLGIGKLFEHKKTKRAFSVISSVALAVFGLVIIKGAATAGTSALSASGPQNLWLSFLSVFLLTISSPMTIVFFTSLFTAKAVEYNYAKQDLYWFGLGTGLATFLFMGSSVIFFSTIKGNVPPALIRALNLLVGGLLVGYGVFRFTKTYKQLRENHQ